MTKKDYELIVESFNTAIESMEIDYRIDNIDDYKASVVVQLIKEILATNLKLDNENFDRDKFFAAFSNS